MAAGPMARAEDLIVESIDGSLSSTVSPTTTYPAGTSGGTITTTGQDSEIEFSPNHSRSSTFSTDGPTFNNIGDQFTLTFTFLSASV